MRSHRRMILTVVPHLQQGPLIDSLKRKILIRYRSQLHLGALGLRLDEYQARLDDRKKLDLIFIQLESAGLELGKIDSPIDEMKEMTGYSLDSNSAAKIAAHSLSATPSIFDGRK